MTKEEFDALCKSYPEGKIQPGTRFRARSRGIRKGNIGRTESRFKYGLNLRFDHTKNFENRWSTKVDRGWFPCEELELVKE